MSKKRPAADAVGAKYEGHSRARLNRIAVALNHLVEIRFVPAERRLQSA